MGLLLFKKCFFEAIRAGRKRTTIRRWSSARVRPGARVFAPGLGYLRVLEVQPVSLAKLKPADAHADGFATLAAMRRALASMYDDVSDDGKHWWRVRFETE